MLYSSCFQLDKQQHQLFFLYVLSNFSILYDLTYSSFLLTNHYPLPCFTFLNWISLFHFPIRKHSVAIFPYPLSSNRIFQLLSFYFRLWDMSSNSPCFSATNYCNYCIMNSVLIYNTFMWYYNNFLFLSVFALCIDICIPGFKVFYSRISILI